MGHVMTGKVVKSSDRGSSFCDQGKAFEQGLVALLNFPWMNPALITDNLSRIRALYQVSLEYLEGQLNSPSQKENQPWGYLSLAEEEQFSAGLLTVLPGTPIPIHDHPGSTGLLVVLKGQVKAHLYETVEQDAGSNTLSLKRTSVGSAGVGEFVTFGPDERNIHSLEACKEPVVLFDLLISPYKPEERSWFLPMDPTQGHSSSSMEVLRVKQRPISGQPCASDWSRRSKGLNMVEVGKTKKRPISKIIGLLCGLGLSANAWSANEQHQQVAMVNAYTPLSNVREIDRDGSVDRAEILYRLGIDTKKLAKDDDELYEAFAWLKQAAELGLAKAQYIIGLMYADGIGVSADEDQAIEWLSRASGQNHEGAKFAFAYMLKTEFFVGC